jgi:hypothetical protein
MAPPPPGSMHDAKVRTMNSSEALSARCMGFRGDALSRRLGSFLGAERTQVQRRLMAGWTWSTVKRRPPCAVPWSAWLGERNRGGGSCLSICSVSPESQNDRDCHQNTTGEPGDKNEQKWSVRKWTKQWPCRRTRDPTDKFNGLRVRSERQPEKVRARKCEGNWDEILHKDDETTPNDRWSSWLGDLDCVWMGA